MSFSKPTMAIAATALLIAAGSASASAQESCGDLYNRMMWTYQNAGPQSPQYAQMYSFYNARCLSGASAAPYQAPYGYYQPAPVDPGAAFLGGAVGAVVGEALEGDRRGRDRRDYRDDRRDYRGDYRGR